jgi:hypothetical protein
LGFEPVASSRSLLVTTWLSVEHRTPHGWLSRIILEITTITFTLA